MRPERRLELITCLQDTGARKSVKGDSREKQIAVVATEVTTLEAAPAPDVQPAKDGPELTPEQVAEFRFEFDSPVVSNGSAVALVTGRLTIDGWLLTRTGIASLASR